MPRVLELYNLWGAVSEQVWWEVPAAIAASSGGELELSVAYEALASGAIEPPNAMRWARVQVEATEDVGGQMDRLAEEAGHPARRAADRLQDVKLVHGHTGPRVLLAGPLLARGVPSVISLYGYDASRLLRDPCWVERYRWAAERGAVFVVLGEAMRRHVIGLGLPESSVRVIRLGVDLRRWAFEPTASTEKAFVFVGRLVEKKGLSVLLEAAALLPGVRVTVVGDGPLRGELQAQAEALGIAERVTFRGALTRDEVAAELGKGAAMVLPSVTSRDGDREGTPVALMEAAARGVVAITTEHGGNAEVLSEAAIGSGMAVAEGDAAALAGAMERVLRMAAPQREAMRRANRAWVEERFDLRNTVTAYGTLYRELISARR